MSGPTTPEEIAEALRQLGGEADVGDIKNRVESNRGGRPSHYASEWSYRCTIQGIINRHCPQSTSYAFVTPTFVKVRRGRYRLD